MRTSTRPLPPDLERLWIERHGGWVLSVCLHVMLFALLYSAAATRPGALPDPAWTRYRVVLAEPTPSPTPDPTPLPVQPLDDPPQAFTPARATTAADASPGPDAAASTSGTDGAAPAAPAAASGAAATATAEPLRDAVSPSPLTSTPAAAEGLLADLDRRLREPPPVAPAGAADAAQGSALVAQRLRLAQADLAAQKTLFRSEGDDSGVVRELDVSDVPPEEAEQVMARYGISILVGRIDRPPPAGRHYLNRAVTNEGQFVSVSGPGMYRIFSYGQLALSRMVQLEAQALRDAGYTPETGRIVHIVFGIVPTTEGFDLGVKRVQAEPIQPAAGR